MQDTLQSVLHKSVPGPLHPALRPGIIRDVNPGDLTPFE
jgi:hypothetical protein